MTTGTRAARAPSALAAYLAAPAALCDDDYPLGRRAGRARPGQPQCVPEGRTARGARGQEGRAGSGRRRGSRRWPGRHRRGVTPATVGAWLQGQAKLVGLTGDRRGRQPSWSSWRTGSPRPCTKLVQRAQDVGVAAQEAGHQDPEQIAPRKSSHHQSDHAVSPFPRPLSLSVRSRFVWAQYPPLARRPGGNARAAAAEPRHTPGAQCPPSCSSPSPRPARCATR